MDAASLPALLALAERTPGVRAAAAALRQHCAPLRVVVVDALDMRDETPVAQGRQYQLFLGASDGHCWTVTTDPARAAGLFIAALG